MIKFRKEDPLRGVSRGGPSFPISDRIKRGIWRFFWILFGYYSPRPFHFWRRGILRAFGARIDGAARIYPRVDIWAPWNLHILGRCGIGEGVTIYNQADITIGNNCVISQGTHLCTGTHDFESSNFELITKPIVIQGEAWICAEVFIHPGVTVGEGCVVGARSVVTNSLPPWTVCSGFPAKPLRERIRVEA